MNIEPNSAYETHVIHLECEGDDWEILLQYLELRERVFRGEKQWDLDEFNGYELDAYDKETSFYLIAVHKPTGEVHGGARLSPTQDDSFQSIIPGDPSGFMIGDAAKGLLPGLPDNMCFEEPPTGPKIWELTRLVTTNRQSTESLFVMGRRFLEEQGVEKLLALGSPAIFRLARTFDLEPVPLGPVTGNESGKFLTFMTSVSEKTDRLDDQDGTGVTGTGIHFGSVLRDGEAVGSAIYWSQSKQISVWDYPSERYFFLNADVSNGHVYSGCLSDHQEIVGQFNINGDIWDIQLASGEVLNLRRAC